MSQPEALHPPGPELAAHNRRILAERFNWPDGALPQCLAFEAEHFGWFCNWSRSGWKRPRTGFYAAPETQMRPDDPRWIYGATMAELENAFWARVLPLPPVLTAAGLVHSPLRPTWNCWRDGQPWPCDGAREELKAMYGDPKDLAAMMWTATESFAHDEPRTPALTMLRQFITWTHSVETE